MDFIINLSRQHIATWIALFTLLAPFSVASAAANNTSAEDLPLGAMGPASFKDGKLHVNGQTIIRDKQTSVENESKGGSTRISQGDYVAIAGDVINSGKALATSIIILDEDYVDGASPTYLRVLIDNVSDTGRAYSADSAIDFSPSLFQDGATSISSGETAEFSGISIDGLLVADQAAMINRSSTVTSGRLASSVRGQRASGVRGQRASGVR